MTQKKREKRNISGWLLLNKPFGMTSTDAVGKVRWLLKAKKAGHAGTLDPLATGLLPIALGEATKTVPYVQDGMKTYLFSLVWGAATTTDDAEGEVIEASDHRPVLADINAALPRFTGTITQVPPKFSAIRIDGARAYDLARAGEDVDMPEREVTISRFALLSHNDGRTDFEVDCEKGTYIRALARDLAKSLGSAGHVGSLHRSAVGGFDDGDAIDFADFEAMSGEERDAALLPVSAGLSGVTEIRIDTNQAAMIRRGNAALLTGASAPVAIDEVWASCKGEAVAVGFVEKGQFKPRRVILG